MLPTTEDSIMSPNTDIEDERFFSLVFSHGVVTRALRVGLIVGTILAFINHGDKILTMTLLTGDIYRIIFTYLVPYIVSSWSSVMAIRAHKQVKD